MADVEKVIKGLECCAHEDDIFCKQPDCPYNVLGGRNNGVLGCPYAGCHRTTESAGTEYTNLAGNNRYIGRAVK